jgi:hypothetical protein
MTAAWLDGDTPQRATPHVTQAAPEPTADRMSTGPARPRLERT